MHLQRFLLFIVASLLSGSAYSQEGDFCDAVSTIMRDAPNKFKNIKGVQLTSSMRTIVWESGIKVPGTIGSRFVAAMGSFYEGAFYQSKSEDGLMALYNSYKEQISACLTPQGYTVSYVDNFYPGMAAYKKVVFMPDTKDVNSKVPPAHVTMEATYNKDIGSYTIVMYIFEH